MKQYKCLIALFAAALFIGACSDDDNDYGTEGIAIETPAVTGETSTSSASLSVAVNMRDDVRYSGAGFCYSLQSSPTIIVPQSKHSSVMEHCLPLSRI